MTDTPSPDNPVRIPALTSNVERLDAVWELTDREGTPEPVDSDEHLLPEDVWQKVRQGAADPEADRFPGDADRDESGAAWPTS